MFGVRAVSKLVGGAILALGMAMAPAVGASDGLAPRLVLKRGLPTARGIGSFTPASADPRLAAIFARAGLDGAGFRFTPSDSRRAITVAVRSRSTRRVASPDRSAPVPPGTVNLVPTAYTLGVAVGWKRFAVTGDLSKVDLAVMPGSRETADIGISYTGRRFSGRVKATADRPLPGSPAMGEEAPAYSIDLGASYALTRRLDLTAGVRYKDERDRLLSPGTGSNPAHRESRAVYIGTAFRF